MADPKTEQIAKLRAEIDRLQDAIASLDRGFHVISKSDVGKGVIDAFGRKWSVLATLGTILPSDVGKRLYLRTDNAGLQFLQAENDAQRDKRLLSRAPLYSAKWQAEQYDLYRCQCSDPCVVMGASGADGGSWVVWCKTCNRGTKTHVTKEEAAAAWVKSIGI